ncbi:MAG TPA: aldehyde dehydrogenase family protein [Deltaproteobacteria bacterium]|nr:aldehyde dehydrogenase family protein [Candidatus Binatota bacterium]HIL12566.1 aldehyde dehydrogenase family protein [Deltaproteobacteria bacterium]
MKEYLQFYIDGAWVDPAGSNTLEVINPATEQAVGRIAMGGAEDVDRAVKAARQAFETFSLTSVDERIALLEKIVAGFQARYEEFAQTISSEMGAPITLCQLAQAGAGLAHFAGMVEIAKGYAFEQQRGTTMLRKEPVGVCGLITPWNWPINQIACKVAPAIAAGCTMVLKPSELAPLNACLLAEVIHDAGVPAGVFNLVNGDGPSVGAALSAHPGIDMMSFTGSTRAGTAVAEAAAPGVKRVAQELGGKSANIVLDDADLEAAVSGGVQNCFGNSGQSCNAPTRMLVPADRHDEAMAIARKAAEAAAEGVGDPTKEETVFGPLAHAGQYEKVQGLINKGLEEGATLVAGGPGRPEGLDKGYFVRPTVFANVSNDMTIAREEVFGPVLCILPYRDEEQAIAIANDTEYGLSGYVQSGDIEHARRVASRLRTGNVHINGAGPDFAAPFGGYGKSGNGREWGEFGLEEFLEVKAVLGWEPA